MSRMHYNLVLNASFKFQYCVLIREHPGLCKSECMCDCMCVYACVCTYMSLSRGVCICIYIYMTFEIKIFLIHPLRLCIFSFMYLSIYLFILVCYSHIMKGIANRHTYQKNRHWFLSPHPGVWVICLPTQPSIFGSSTKRFFFEYIRHPFSMFITRKCGILRFLIILIKRKNLEKMRKGCRSWGRPQKLKKADKGYSAFQHDLVIKSWVAVGPFSEEWICQLPLFVS